MPIEISLDQLKRWRELIIGPDLTSRRGLRIAVNRNAESLVGVDRDLLQLRAAAHIPAQGYGRVAPSYRSTPVNQLLGGSVLAVDDQRRLGEELLVIRKPVARHGEIVVVPAGSDEINRATALLLRNLGKILRESQHGGDARTVIDSALEPAIAVCDYINAFIARSRQRAPHG